MSNILVYGADVERVSLPNRVERPEWASSRWKGIGHRDMAETLIAQLINHGCVIENEAWSLASEGRACVGAVAVRSPNLPELAGMDYGLAVMHDNAGVRALRLSVGAAVRVCNNGIITGDFVVRRRHTIGLDLEEVMAEGVERAIGLMCATADIIYSWQFQHVEAAEVLLEVGRQGILSWSNVGRAVKEYDKPPLHFEQYHGTAFGVYQAVNSVIKRTSVPRQIDGLARLTRILGEV